MATPQIGSFSFITMRGARPLAPALRVEEITRDNADGHAFRDIGSRADRVEVVTLVDNSAPATLEVNYRALMGTLVTVAMPEGLSITNVMVHDVRVEGVFKTLTPVGGIAAGTWVVQAVWSLQAA